MLLDIAALQARALKLGKSGKLNYVRKECLLDMSGGFDGSVKEYRMTTYLIYYEDSVSILEDSPYILLNGSKIYCDVQGIADAIVDSKNELLDRYQIYDIMLANMSDRLARYLYFDEVLTEDGIASGFYDQFITHGEQNPLFFLQLKATKRVRGENCLKIDFNYTPTSDFLKGVQDLCAQLDRKRAKPKESARKLGELICEHYTAPIELTVQIYSGPIYVAVFTDHVPMSLEYGFVIGYQGMPVTLHPKTNTDYVTKIRVETASTFANSKDVAQEVAQ